MLDTFKFEKRASYPHMSVADTLLWNKFLDQYPQAYESVQYDFHVGEAPPFNTLMDDDSDKNQDKLYRFRIDAVGRYGSSVDIIEIKPDARHTAIGEVENYARLYKRDEEPLGAVTKVIITDRELPNMDYLCKEAGIKLIVV